MVLLTEQERLYADEYCLVNGENSSHLSSLADWTTEKTYTFTLSKRLIVMIRASVYVQNGSGAGRITVDGNPLWSTGGVNGYTTVVSPDLYIVLAAGSHTFNFDCAMWSAGSGAYVVINGIYIGQLNFNDLLSGGPWDSGSVALPAGVQETLINQNITIPASRVLPCGTIINYGLFILVVASDVAISPTRKTHMKNAGEGDDSGKINVRLYLNSGESGWSDRHDDDADGVSANASYGRGSEGYWYGYTPPNQTLNIQVKALCSSARSAECFVFVLLCPWIIPPVGYDASVVNLTFSQGSTFYAYLEPLYVDATKASKIGMKHFKSFGDTTDYYSVVSGTGILIHTYTLDVVDVVSAQWVVNPSGNVVCISYVAVDLR
jgi:hypothetical protein